jgi:hypothetical protein
MCLYESQIFIITEPYHEPVQSSSHVNNEFLYAGLGVIVCF